MPDRTCWYQTAGRHFAADLGRVGSILVWSDPSTDTWSVFALGSQQTGFATTSATQAGATRLARELLQDGLQCLDELEGTIALTA